MCLRFTQAKHMDSSFPYLGFGLGLRAKHYPYIFENRPSIDWFEIISENFMESEGRPKHNLQRVMENYRIVMHGVSMSIGTVDPLNSEYLRKLKKLIDWVKPAWVSDHLCWTGVAHGNTHDLLPLPYTEESLRHVVSKIRQVQDYLGQRIALENPSTYLEFKSSHMPEAEFIARMADEADCMLLLDVNNVYVSCFNHRLDPQIYLDSLALNRVMQIHLSGHSNMGTHIIDTHDDYVVDEVWNLYKYVVYKSGRIPNTMIEWDDKIPEFPVLAAELEKAKRAAVSAHTFQLPVINTVDKTAAPDFKQNLAEEQGRMQKAIIQGKEFDSRPEMWIVAKDKFSPRKQLDVYVNAYSARLFDVTAEDYPVLRHYLGDDEFDSVITSFVDSVASDHFNIARYALKLPAFLAAERPKDKFAYELCLLETALSDLIDAPDTDALTFDQLSSLTPESLMNMRLFPRAALRLFAFAFDVESYYRAVKEEDNSPPPALAACYLAVFRHEDVVWRMRLEEDEFNLLEGIFGGLNVGDALETLPPNYAEKVSSYFARWMLNGLLATHQYQPKNTQEVAHAAA